MMVHLAVYENVQARYQGEYFFRHFHPSRFSAAYLLAGCVVFMLRSIKATSPSDIHRYLLVIGKAYKFGKAYTTIIILCCVFSCLAQKPSTIIYNPGDQMKSMAYGAVFFEDKTNKLSAEQIASLPEQAFEKVKGRTINLGFSSNRVWLKFAIDNRTSEALYAYVEAQELDYIEVYVKAADTTYYMETGALRPF